MGYKWATQPGDFMKIAIWILVFLTSMTALAMKDGKYNCTITEQGGGKSVVGLSFIMKKGEIQCLEGDNDDWCKAWFKYTSQQEQRKFWLDGLADGGYGFDDQGNFDLTADSDGYDFATFKLYKNSGFSKGFITTVFRCGAGPTEKYAGKVFCQVK